MKELENLLLSHFEKYKEKNSTLQKIYEVIDSNLALIEGNEDIKIEMEANHKKSGVST